MTKAEFCSLPPAMALGIVYDMAEPKLRDMSRPRPPLPPKYDGRLGRSGGFWWMSEMDLNSLEFWESKNREGADAGGRYAEANSKAAANLAKWIEWRRLFPNECWSGTRGDDRATGAPPSREPTLRKWPAKKGGQSNQSSGAPSPDNDGREEEPEYSF